MPSDDRGLVLPVGQHAANTTSHLFPIRFATNTFKYGSLSIELSLVEVIGRQTIRTCARLERSRQSCNQIAGIRRCGTMLMHSTVGGIPRRNWLQMVRSRSPCESKAPDY